jgi:allantoinase
MAQAHLAEAIVTPEGIRRGAVIEAGGRIVGICDVEAVPAGLELANHGALALLPGLVDTHVHINEPGRGEWEGFRTATRAAAAGGYTTLVDMPLNGLPETTTVAALEAKRAAAEGQCAVDWAAWGGCVADNQSHLEGLAAAGVCGYKCFLIYPGCEGFTMVDRAQLEAALPAIARTGLPLLVHAELDGPIAAAAAGLAGADWRKYATYLASRPDEAELEAIRMLIGLCREYGFRLHIVHLATALALPELRAAKAEGLPITVETCPHYLYFAAGKVPYGSTVHKCAPPIRSEANREGLWEGLRDGTIDLVATDHSPCPRAMKRMDVGRFDLAWGGIASLSVALPVMWTEASRRGFGLSDVVRWMSAAPARLAGLQDRRGEVTVGREASWLVFDPDAEWTVGENDLYFRHKTSPYLGERLRGRVMRTYLRGEQIFSRDAAGTGVFGREVGGVELRLGGG